MNLITPRNFHQKLGHPNIPTTLKSPLVTTSLHKSQTKIIIDRICFSKLHAIGLILSNSSIQAIEKFLSMYIYEITQYAPLSECFVVAACNDFLFALLETSMGGFCFESGRQIIWSDRIGQNRWTDRDYSYVWKKLGGCYYEILVNLFERFWEINNGQKIVNGSAQQQTYLQKRSQYFAYLRVFFGIEESSSNNILSHAIFNSGGLT